MQMWAFSRNTAAVSAASLACIAVVPGRLTWSGAPDGWKLLSLAVGAAAYAAWAYRTRTSLELDTFVRALSRRTPAQAPRAKGP
jgi:hypothetical protein